MTVHKQPHAYVGWPNSRWRTCQVCGIGANATIHRPCTKPNDTDQTDAGTATTTTERE